MDEATEKELLALAKDVAKYPFDDLAHRILTVMKVAYYEGRLSLRREELAKLQAQIAEFDHKHIPEAEVVA